MKSNEKLPTHEELAELGKLRRKRLTQRLAMLRERAHLIELELDQYTGKHFRVCIFGSARTKPDDEVYQMTHKIAYLLGGEGIDVLTGGGPGLMEAANLGVKAGRNDSGSKSKSFGISIELGNFEPENEHLDIKHHHRKFSSRLDDFMRLSNAIIVMPGGIGTTLELVFSWQLLQVGHMTDRPIVLFDSEFWAGFIKWTKETLVERGLVSSGDHRWLHLADTPDQAVDIVKEVYATFLEKLKGDSTNGSADSKEAEGNSDIPEENTQDEGSDK